MTLKESPYVGQTPSPNTNVIAPDNSVKPDDPKSNLHAILWTYTIICTSPKTAVKKIVASVVLTKPYSQIFNTEGQITPDIINQYHPKSNSYKILWIFIICAILKTTDQNVWPLTCLEGFVCLCWKFTTQSTLLRSCQADQLINSHVSWADLVL